MPFFIKPCGTHPLLVALLACAGYQWSVVLRCPAIVRGVRNMPVVKLIGAIANDQATIQGLSEIGNRMPQRLGVVAIVKVQTQSRGSRKGAVRVSLHSEAKTVAVVFRFDIVRVDFVPECATYV